MFHWSYFLSRLGRTTMCPTKLPEEGLIKKQLLSSWVVPCLTWSATFSKTENKYRKVLLRRSAHCHIKILPHMHNCWAADFHSTRSAKLRMRVNNELFIYFQWCLVSHWNFASCTCVVKHKTTLFLLCQILLIFGILKCCLLFFAEYMKQS